MLFGVSGLKKNESFNFTIGIVGGLSRCLGPGECLHSFIVSISDTSQPSLPETVRGAASSLGGLTGMCGRGRPQAEDGREGGGHQLLMLRCY